jgi:hypothetical protein
VICRGAWCLCLGDRSVFAVVLCRELEGFLSAILLRLCHGLLHGSPLSRFLHLCDGDVDMDMDGEVDGDSDGERGRNGEATVERE